MTWLQPDPAGYIGYIYLGYSQTQLVISGILTWLQPDPAGYIGYIYLWPGYSQTQLVISGILTYDLATARPSWLYWVYFTYDLATARPSWLYWVYLPMTWLQPDPAGYIGYIYLWLGYSQTQLVILGIFTYDLATASPSWLNWVYLPMTVYSKC